MRWVGVRTTLPISDWPTPGCVASTSSAPATARWLPVVARLVKAFGASPCVIVLPLAVPERKPELLKRRLVPGPKFAPAMVRLCGPPLAEPLTPTVEPDAVLIAPPPPGPLARFAVPPLLTLVVPPMPDVTLLAVPPLLTLTVPPMPAVVEPAVPPLLTLAVPPFCAETL